jgi:mannobiose 2-epimerase
MTAKERAAWAAEIEKHLLGHILPFWAGPAMESNRGGWHAWLSHDLKPEPTRPRGLVLNTRILWTFAAAHDRRPEALFHDRAEVALRWVRDRFWDPVHGGGFWHLDEGGRVRNDTKQIYGQAFYVYAMTQYHLAFYAPEVLDRAQTLYRLIDRYAHDSRHGGYFEAFERDWSKPAISLVGGHELGAAKSMNTNLHVLEAWTTLYQAWQHPAVAARLRELLLLFLEKILNPQTGHLEHYFAADWRVLSDNYTYGHDIEASWLLCEAAEALNEEALVKRARSAAVLMAEAVAREGLGADGGVAYEGRAGRVTDTGRDWWVQAEALVGFLNAWQITGQKTYAIAARRVWDFIRTRVADPEYGDWHWRVDTEGRPDRSRPKVSEWKGPYHSSRACLEAIRRLVGSAGAS